MTNSLSCIKLMKLVIVVVYLQQSIAFAVSKQMIYGIPNSGWTCPEWNWGYAVGTGHDCAAKCRSRYDSELKRRELVEALLRGEGPSNFEEVKLVLALAWQKGRWDGSDGGPGGYGDVLTMMAQAKRYEEGADRCKLLVLDMEQRFELLKPTKHDLHMMNEVNGDLDSGNIQLAKRKCAGLVLNCMGFAQRGL
jgi:hypothetical protein